MDGPGTAATTAALHDAAEETRLGFAYPLIVHE